MASSEYGVAEPVQSQEEGPRQMGTSRGAQIREWEQEGAREQEVESFLRKKTSF